MNLFNISLMNEGDKDSKRILEVVNEEVKVYFEFLIIFLKDTNEVRGEVKTQSQSTFDFF